MSTSVEEEEEEELTIPFYLTSAIATNDQENAQQSTILNGENSKESYDIDPKAVENSNVNIRIDEGKGSKNKSRHSKNVSKLMSKYYDESKSDDNTGLENDSDES